MTVWTRVVYCESAPGGDMFTLVERAKDCQAIRRSASMRFSEEDLRRALASLGEPAEIIDTMIAQARGRTPT